MTIDVRVVAAGDGWTATVDIEQDGARTRHRVTVTPADLQRYSATDVADLVRRSFAFLLEREPNTSILREFRLTEIERYFPGYGRTISAG